MLFIVKCVVIKYLSVTRIEPVNYIIRPMYVVRYLKRNWNFGVWIQIKWNHAVGQHTVYTEIHR